MGDGRLVGGENKRGVMMTKDPGQNVTMRVRIGDSELEVTGPVDFVERKIAEFVKTAPHQSPTSAAKSPAQPPPAPHSGKPMSPNQFFKKAAVKSDVGRVLLAAYYLEKLRNSESVTATDVKNLIKEGKVPPPKNVNEAINQNIRKGLVMSAGNKDNRMAYVVTSDGEDEVTDMLGKSDA